MLNFKLCWFGDCDVDFADWIGNAGLFGKRVPSIASPALSLPLCKSLCEFVWEFGYLYGTAFG